MAQFRQVWARMWTWIERAANVGILIAVAVVCIGFGRNWINLGTATGVTGGSLGPVRLVRPEDGIVTTLNDWAKGAGTARLAMVEFSDFECPFCGAYARETLPQLNREFIDTGRIRYVFRHFPLERVHASAMGASQAAECAGGQGLYWLMHDRLFANQKALGRSDLAHHAARLGLDPAGFETCMDDRAVLARVLADQAEGLRLGVRSTPTFLVGRVELGQRIRVLRIMTGAQPWPILRDTLAQMLTEEASGVQ